MNITNYLLLILILISLGRWITSASINYKLGEIKKLLSHLSETELPALTSAVLNITGLAQDASKSAFIWPNRNNLGMHMRH
ncbi:MAG: hypothetical protein JW908_00440 [Anaerolineales bacterium]|nr:hypothetical protein [Anaerolineales bacterium]